MKRRKKRKPKKRKISTKWSKFENNKKKGWYKESKRHSLASRGIKTKKRKIPPGLKDNITGDYIEFGRGEFGKVSGEKELYKDPYSLKTYSVPKELVPSPVEDLDTAMKKHFLLGREKGRIERERPPPNEDWIFEHRYNPKEKIVKPVSKVASGGTDINLTEEDSIKFYEGVPLDVNVAYEKLQDELPERYQRGLDSAVDLGESSQKGAMYKVFAVEGPEEEGSAEFFVNIGKKGEVEAVSKYGDFKDIKIKDGKVYKKG